MDVMSDTIRAIILDVRDHKENDAMIKALTYDHGLLTFIAKGTKKMTSKNAIALMPYSISDITYDHKETKDIFTLYKAELYKSYYQEDISILAGMSLIAKLTLSTIDKENKELLYKEVVKALDNTKDHDIKLIVTIFIAFISRLLGFEAYVEGCVVCDVKKVVSFSSLKGGFLCLEHLGDEKVMTPDILRQLRYIFKATQGDIDILERYDIDEKVYHLVAEHLYTHTDLDKRAYDFFKMTF